MKKFFGKTVGYFKESWIELSKVVWPTRKQVLEMTIAVVLLSICVGLLLGISDFGIAKALSWLINLKK
jgi:preprotein translocase subunit SecE